MGGGQNVLEKTYSSKALRHLKMENLFESKMASLLRDQAVCCSRDSSGVCDYVKIFSPSLNSNIVKMLFCFSGFRLCTTRLSQAPQTCCLCFWTPRLQWTSRTAMVRNSNVATYSFSYSCRTNCSV